MSESTQVKESRTRKRPLESHLLLWIKQEGVRDRLELDTQHVLLKATRFGGTDEWRRKDCGWETNRLVQLVYYLGLRG